MGFWTAIVLIVLITSIAGAFSRRRRHRSDGELQDGERQQLEHERDAARAELEDLRERVKVLERIATDPARRTAEEIERLRDE